MDGPACKRILSALLAGALLAGPGCTRRYIIPTDELQKLDGFDDRALDPDANPRASARRHPVRKLLSNNGVELSFDAYTDLRLLGPNVSTGGRFRQIRVTPSLFEGVLTESNQAFRVDLLSVSFGQIEAIDPLSTTLVVVGVVTAALAALVLLIPRAVLD